MAPGVSFDSYKRATPIRSPRGDDTTAPRVMSSSEYLRKKYGDFSGATEVVRPPAPVRQTQIMGAAALTLGDLKLLQNAVDIEMIRLTNLRTDSALVKIRLGQLQGVAENLGDVVGRVDRGEIKAEEVAIFPGTARQFLKTFRTSENIPELFDPAGNSPKSEAAPGTTLAPAPAPTSATEEETKEGPDFLHWVYTTLQRLKWSVDAEYMVETAKQREMKDTLGDMEQRVLGYSYTDTPMPEGYQKMFLERIRGLQKELNVPE